MNNNTLLKIGMAGACAGLLSLAMAAKAAEPYSPAQPLSTQCKLALNPQMDNAMQPYVAGLAAMGANPSWLVSVCPEASTKGDEGAYRLKATLGAHLLHQVSTHGTLSANQRKAIGQAIDHAKGLGNKDLAMELVYVDARSNAALAGLSADGLVYGLKDTAPAVANTLDAAALRWGP